MQCTLCNALYALKSMNCPLFIALYAFYSRHCILGIIFNALYLRYCIIGIVLCAFFSCTIIIYIYYIHFIYCWNSLLTDRQTNDRRTLSRIELLKNLMKQDRQSTGRPQAVSTISIEFFFIFIFDSSNLFLSKITIVPGKHITKCLISLKGFNMALV